jgi:hypothetical protein
MKTIYKLLIPLAAVLGYVMFISVTENKLEPAEGYPVWMRDTSGLYTDQTSGIIFTGYSGISKTFLTCDDVGHVSRIIVDESTLPVKISVKHLEFSAQMQEELKDFKKKDFEEISVDRENGRMFLVLEGFLFEKPDSMRFKDFEGVYEVKYNKDVMTCDTLLSIKRLEGFKPAFEHTFDNLGLEGFAVSKNYYFCGLENYAFTRTTFTDSTNIYIFDKSYNLKRTIHTSGMKISTACGLYAADDFHLYGVDRNTRQLFYIEFNPDMSVKRTETKGLDLTIPGHKNINEILGTAIESITLDDKGSIYIAIDPAKEFYKPDLYDKKKLTKEELGYFEAIIPILYKYSNPFK